MLKIECDSNKVDVIKFVDKNNNGKEMHKQTLFWHRENVKYPVQFEISIDSNAEPLQPGIYDVNADLLIDLDRFNSLSVNSYAVYDVIKGSHFVAAKPQKAA